MPQGRKKIPFSGKAKKQQLQAKKQTKKEGGGPAKRYFVDGPPNDAEGEGAANVQKLNYQPTKSGRMTTNRYALQFFKESDSEIRLRREEARKSLNYVTEEGLEINGDDYFPKELDFPKRPSWSFDMSREELDAKENKYMNAYIKEIENHFSWKELSFFELNLETWRQLWRVLEMSDIVLYIVDIRYPAVMFPPSLYDYVTKVLRKDFILILNKIDLAKASVVAAWKNYFQEKYPELHIIMFTTVPGYNLRGDTGNKAGLQVRRRKGKLRMAAEGAQLLLETCKAIVKDDVDLKSWENKIKEEMNMEYEDDDKVQIEETIELRNVDTSYFEHERYKNNILTVGCLGQPNVGKSSIMNALMGRKVVSVSRTPGHTKHFQTIYLTKSVRLCDCPGLVFPSKVPKVLQVLMGSFPIAQLREPFTTIKYLAERLDLPGLLRINHPEDDDCWSAMDICDGWAKKRGYHTAKAARLDSYRAANSLLRMALDGKICLCLRPPGYTAKKDYWAKHPDVEKVKWVQAKTSEAAEEFNQGISDSDEESQSEKATEMESIEGSGEEVNDDDDEDDDDEEPVGRAVTNPFEVLQECS